MAGFKLMAELGLDGAAFAAGFRKAKGVAEGMAEGLKHVIIGAIGVVTVEEALRRTVETAKELVETSERLAIAPEQLQVMRQAAKNANMDFEKLVETMEKLSIAREKALIPGKEGLDARRAFGAFGIREEQLHSMTSANMLLGPIRNAVLGRNPEEIGIIFRELGIKAFGGLIPLLKTNFEQLEAKMKSLGEIMDTETAVKLKSLSDEFNILTRIITAHFGPALLKFAEWAYGALLKIGSGAMKGYSVAGQMVKEQGVGGTITSFLSGLVHMGAHAIGQLSDKEYYDKMAALAPKGQPAGLGKDNFFDEAQKQFKEFLDEMKKRADELDHPKPGDFSESSIPAKLPKKALVEQSDSLVKIGNFLGGNDRVINRLQEKQVYWLEKIHGKIAANSGFRSQTNFPVEGQVSTITMGPNFPHN